MASPEQELAGFLRRIGACAPVETCATKAASKGSPIQHVATCATEAVEWQGHSIPSTFNTAEASRKKVAQKAATQQALDQLKRNPAWAASQPPDRIATSLLQTLQNMLSDEVSDHHRLPCGYTQFDHPTCDKQAAATLVLQSENSSNVVRVCC